METTVPQKVIWLNSYMNKLVMLPSVYCLKQDTMLQLSIFKINKRYWDKIDLKICGVDAFYMITLWQHRE